MKKRFSMMARGVACMLPLVLAAAPQADAVVFFDFSEESQLTDNFIAGAGNDNRFNWQSSGGVGDSPALRPFGGDATALYTGQTFSLQVGETLQYSMVVRKISPGAAPSRMLQLGFSNLAAADGRIFTTDAVSFLSARIDSASTGQDGQFRLAIQHRDVSLTTLNQNTFSLISDHRYRFTTTFERTATDTFLISAALEDWGADGLTYQGVVATIEPTEVTNAAMGNAVELHAGFRGEYTAGNIRVDDFSIVPEPAALSLLAMGGLLLARRRCRS